MDDNSDNALDWQAITISRDGRKLAAAPKNGAIHTSGDNGATWSAGTSGTNTWRTIAGSEDGNRLIAAADSKVILSSDAGTTWTEIEALKNNSEWKAVAASHDGRVLTAVRSYKAYVSTDHGVTWKAPSVSGMSYLDCAAVSGDGNTVLAGSFYSSGGSGRIWVSTDGGATFSALAGAPQGAWIELITNEDGTVIVVAGQRQTLQVGVKTGTTWTWTPQLSALQWAGIACSADGKTIAAAGHDSKTVHLSADTGTTWHDQVGSAQINGIGLNSAGNLLATANRDGTISVTNNPYAATATPASTATFKAQLTAATRNDQITLDRTLLTPFAGDVVSKIIGAAITVTGVQVSSRPGTLGMEGVAGAETPINDKGEVELGVPDNHALILSGKTTLLSTDDTGIEVAFFHHKGKPNCAITLTLPTPLSLNQVLSGAQPARSLAGITELPIIGSLALTDPKIIVQTLKTVYDPGLDSGINEGFNAFANIKISESTNDIVRLVGKLLQLKELALHAAIDASGRTPEFVFEMAAKRQITLVDTSAFKLRLTRSDFGISVKGTPPEPAFTLSSDLVVSLKEGTSTRHLVFTGGFKLEPESLTGSFTMNGTGRHPDGELTGKVQNSGAWDKPFGIPGISLRRMAVEAGVNVAGALDSFGIVGDMRLGAVDGMLAFKVDITDPDEFVIAADFEKLKVADVIKAVSPLRYVPLSQVQGVFNQVFDLSLKGVKVNIVPTACSIGGIHFRDEGVTVQGRSDLWGWGAGVYLVADTSDGLRLKLDMDSIDLAGIVELTGVGPNNPGPVLQANLAMSGTPTLAGSARMKLFGATERVDLQGNNDGIKLTFSHNWLSLNTNLVASISPTRYSASGTMGVFLNCKLPTPLGNLNLINVSFTLQTAISVAVGAEFSMSLSGALNLYGVNISFPTLTLSTPPTGFDTLYTAILNHLAVHGLDLIKMVWGKFEDLADAVARGSVELTVNALSVAKSVYNADPESAVKAALRMQASAQDIVQGLNTFYQLPADAALTVLKNSGLDSVFAATGLGPVYNLGTDALALVLKRGGYNAWEVATGLQAQLADATGIPAALKAAGFPVNDIGAVMKSVLQSPQNQIASTLKLLGFNGIETGMVLKGLYGFTEFQLTTVGKLLHAAGFDAVNVTGFLNVAWDGAANLKLQWVAAALKDIGVPVKEAGVALNTVLNISHDALRYTLLAGGFVSTEVFHTFGVVGKEIAAFFAQIQFVKAFNKAWKAISKGFNTLGDVFGL
ncbi:MAG: exo-alpha-sialidase [Gammaproteobacteria bacterium]|nr:exo-alpha-sialidase [Gammaproteobacteria bacterium]MCP5138078.1 exo-alpha-sialidase [Gammaproteobacteria bacterium]